MLLFVTEYIKKKFIKYLKLCFFICLFTLTSCLNDNSNQQKVPTKVSTKDSKISMTTGSSDEKIQSNKEKHMTNFNSNTNSNTNSNSSLNNPNIETATLAGGCFWGVEELFRELAGVTQTTVGYTGGTVENPTYEIIKRGTTGHAESIEIKFDKTKTSYEKILKFFFKIHDPTTLNQQGNDIGIQYRSAIFYHSEEQKQTAEKIKSLVDKSGAWKKPIVTEIVPAKKFYSAEEYHQKYLVKNPNGYTCHYVRKIEF